MRGPAEESRPVGRVAWRRRAVVPALAAPVVAAVLGATAAGPSLAATGPTARLTVTKASTDGVPISAMFVIHAGSPTGPPVGRPLVVDRTARRDLLIGRRYCLEETAVQEGYAVSPTYSVPRGCVTLTAALTIAVFDPPVPAAATTGELEVIQTDLSGQPVSEPGFAYDVHVGSAGGPVAATLTTSSSGTAIVTALDPATYCLEATAAPPDYQLAPTYSPGACVAVAADPSQGRSPTRVTVSDAPVPSPSPSAVATAGAARSAGPGAPQGPGHPAAAAALLGFGGLLVLGGVVVIVLALRRRRLVAEVPPVEPTEPEGTWYDSTIT